MDRTSSTGGETLERLHGDEVALERAIDEARREASARLEAARHEAEGLVSAARREAEQEAARLRATWAEALDRERAGEGAARDVELAAIAACAAANRDRALARALAVVLGEPP